jgi:mono/diheme cytochrome c family protein
LTATFSSIQSVIFQPRCVSCHNGTTQTPDLRAAAAYNSLVNARSAQRNLMLVAPGSPETSYLCHKLEGRSGISGSRMPLGGPFLTTADADVMRSWIQAGALNN